MDKNKKNLSPDLKAVYDRVMNTKITPRPQAPPPAPTPQPPSTPPVPQEITPPEVKMPEATISTPPPPDTNRPQMVTETIPPKSSVDLSPVGPEPSSSDQPFLSSLPPRPLNAISSEPFVFSGGKSSSKETPEAHESTTPAPAHGAKLSSKIILGLFILFLVVYSFFWAKIFNLF